MSDDRFAPPGAEVLMPAAVSDVPEAILKKIRSAWIAGLISAAVTVIFVLIAISGTSLLGMSAYQFVDVALILGLTFGIYRKSRICAVLMLAYFVWAKVVLIQQGHANGIGLFMAVVFFYFYLQGVIGTFGYHKHLKQKVP
jgi:serine/threonine-protein kinase